jgi:hypothetical protein
MITSKSAQPKVREDRCEYRILVTESDTYIYSALDPELNKQNEIQYFTVVKAVYRTARELGELDLDNLPSDVSRFLIETPEYMSIHHIDHLPPYEANALSITALTQEFDERSQAFNKPFIYASKFYP